MKIKRLDKHEALQINGGLQEDYDLGSRIGRYLRRIAQGLGLAS